MKLTATAAAALAAEPELTGADLRIWLALVDHKATSADLARQTGLQPTHAAAACRRLLYAGWIDIAEEVGRSKRYTARATRNPNAALPGQAKLDL